MSLFAIMTDYVALRSPASKAEEAEKSVDYNVLTKDVEQSVSDAYCKSKRASAENWVAVHAIAQEYAKEIANTVTFREKLKMSEYYLSNGGNIRNPERTAKILEVNSVVFRVARKVRDFQSEIGGRKWSSIFLRMSCESISWIILILPRLAEKTEWFQPNEGEFLALFTYNERRQNLYNKVSDSCKNMNELFHPSRKKIDAIHEEMLRSVPKVFRDREAVGRAINALEGDDIVFYRKWRGLKKELIL